MKRKSSVRLPPSWPTYILKCIWDSTAVTIKVVARDEVDAVDKAWKQMRRTEGGDKCVDIIVKGRIG